MAQQTAVMQLINFILVERRQQDGSIKFHSNEDFGRFLKMEKEQRIKDYNAGYTDAQCNHVNDAENYANEQEYLNQTYKKD